MQNKCKPYLDDVDDFMNLVQLLGFAMMFAVVAPLMTSLALGCFYVHFFILMFKLSFLMKRPYPEHAHGIGVWIPIMRILGELSVVTNVALLCFVLPPTRHLPILCKVVLFVLAEHGLFIFARCLGVALSGRSSIITAISERNRELEDEILWDDVPMKVKLDRTPTPKMKLFRDPGDASPEVSAL